MKQHDPKQLSGLDKAARSLCDAILLLNTQTEIRQFLTDLCTPAELEAMYDRWGVALLLAEGLSYRDISLKTGVSVTTIGRVARFMDMGAGGYKLALQRIKEN
jgi:TrpR-related protein YerC/YecD